MLRPGLLITTNKLCHKKSRPSEDGQLGDDGVNSHVGVTGWYETSSDGKPRFPKVINSA